MITQSKLTIIFGKGGAAKSLLSASIASIAMHAGRHVEVFDFDPANPSIRHQFSLPPEKVLNRGDGDDYVYKSFGMIADAATSGKNVVVDLGAGMDRPLLRFLRNEDFLEFCSSSGIAPVFVMPISSKDSLGNIRTALQSVPNLPLLCILNRFFPSSAEAEEHSAFQEIRKVALGVADLPNLGRIVREAANENMSLFRMANDEKVSPWLRHGARVAMKKVEEALASYAGHLP